MDINQEEFGKGMPAPMYGEQLKAAWADIEATHKASVESGENLRSDEEGMAFKKSISPNGDPTDPLPVNFVSAHVEYPDREHADTPKDSLKEEKADAQKSEKEDGERPTVNSQNSTIIDAPQGSSGEHIHTPENTAQAESVDENTNPHDGLNQATGPNKDASSELKQELHTSGGAANGIQGAISRFDESKERVNGTVLSGDREAVEEFYGILRRKGHLIERGGMKTVTMSQSGQLEILNRIAKDRGLTVKTALEASMPKGNFGFPKKDTLKVIVIGDKEAIAAKTNEVSLLAEDWTNSGYMKKPETKEKNGADVVLEGVTGSFGKILAQAKAQSGQEKAANSSGGKNETEKAVKEKTEKSTNFEKELPRIMEALTSSKAGLLLKTNASEFEGMRSLGRNAGQSGDNQFAAPWIMRNIKKNLKDSELEKMDTQTRQAFLARLAVVSVLAEEKPLQSGQVPESGAKDAADLRPRLNEMLSKERHADTTFVQNTSAIVQGLVDNKVLTSTQAERVTALLEGRALESRKETSQETSQEKGASADNHAPPAQSELLDRIPAALRREGGPSPLVKDLLSERSKHGPLVAEGADTTKDSKNPETTEHPIKGDRQTLPDPIGRREPYIGSPIDTQNGTAAATDPSPTENPDKDKGQQPTLADKYTQAAEAVVSNPNENLSAQERLKQAVADGVSGKELEPFIDAVAAEAKAQVMKQAGVETKPTQDSLTTNQSSPEQKPQQNDQEQTPTAPATANIAPVAGSSLEATQPTVKEEKAAASNADFHKNEATKESVRYLLSTTKDRAPHAFIAKGKEWNLNTIEKYAKTLAGLEVNRVEQTTSLDERAKLVTHAGLIVDAASRGKIPGFTREQIAVAEKKLTEMANNIPKTALTKETVDSATRVISNMVSVMAERQAESSLARYSNPSPVDTRGLTAAVAVREIDGVERGSIKSGQDLAVGMARSVYGNKALSRKEVTGAIRMGAGRISSQALRGLSMNARARAVTAISTLASKTLQGDFGKVDNNLRDQAHALQGVANEVLREMQQDPRGQQALNQAQKDLGRDTNPAPHSDATKIQAKTPERRQDKASERLQATQSPSRAAGASTGRDMER